MVEVSCQDGSAGRVVLGTDGTARDNLPEALSFLEPTTCTVTVSIAANKASTGVHRTTFIQRPESPRPINL